MHTRTAALLVVLLACRGAPSGADPLGELWTLPDDPVETGDPPPADGVTTLLISIDGLRWDYPDRAATPALDAIAAKGVRATSFEPVFPSVTFPNHYTQVTGLYPAHHGIVANAFYDPESGRSFSMSSTESFWWGGEPIWVTAERQGLTAATCFWPGSEAEIAGYRPTWWLPFDGSMPYEDRVDQALAWLDLPRPPDLITLYFSEVDHAGHGAGPDGSEVVQALEDVDAYLGDLLDGLQARGLGDQVNLVVVSDHGMTALARDRVVVVDDWLDPNDLLAGSWGPVLAFDVPGGGIDDALAALAGAPHLQCAKTADLPERLHYDGNPRIRDAICIADDGWSITTRDWLASNPSAYTGGTHGYDPEVTAMHGVLYASGPGLAGPGVSVPTLSSVHLYELLTALLRVEPAANDGSREAVQALLAP